MRKVSFILLSFFLCMSFPAQGKDMDISMKVHLGNIRAVVSQNDSIEEINHYYPYGSLFGESTGLSNETQPYKYTGKELDRMHGLDLHDHGARWSDANIGRWHKVDRYAERSFDTSPYVLSGNNPLKYLDENGDSTILYATCLPMEKQFLQNMIHSATHTFIVVEKADGTKSKFAYGSNTGGIMSGQLSQVDYLQDTEVMNGNIDKPFLKERIAIEPPNEMTVEQFDNSVLQAGKQFGNQEGITYNILPMSPTEGNCNSSSSTLLYKAGLSQKAIQQLGTKIPGVKWGFGTIKPWTRSEQQRVIQKQSILDKWKSQGIRF